MDCDLDFELWYEEACASIAQAPPSPLPQHLSPYDWKMLLSMFDTPSATVTGRNAATACREMAGGSQGPGQDMVASLQHSTQTQLGATSDHIHDIHSSGLSTVPLQSSSRYSPYNFSARLNAPHTRGCRAHHSAAAAAGLMMEHDHNLTVGVPTMPASLLLPAPPSLLATPASLPPAPASPPPAPASLPPPPTIGSLTTATELLSSLVGRPAELTQWAKGPEASKDAETISNTVKNLRKKIKDIVRITVLYGYNLHEALDTQPQAEIVHIINELLENDAFLNGSINVGGQMIVVPFGHSALRYFIKHVLFYNLNFQQYVNDTNRNIGPLLAFIGMLFRWALQELSTARIAVDDGLSKVYTGLSSERSVRKSGIAASSQFNGLALHQFAEPSLSHFKEALDDLMPSIIPITARAPMETLLIQSKRVSTCGSPKPVCITIPHTGPHATLMSPFFPAIVALALEGYTLNIPNYTSSMGFGQRYIQKLLRHCGSMDVEDVAESIRQLIRRDVSEEGRQVVIGGSHGGFIAAHLIGQHPTLFNAASLRNPVICDSCNPPTPSYELSQQGHDRKIVEKKLSLIGPLKEEPEHGEYQEVLSPPPPFTASRSPAEPRMVEEGGDALELSPQLAHIRAVS
ncbi:uncharacterized protein HD556DRAFT_1459776 [Suillus plorans]|uniref:Dipeptidyl-peptidase V n=1 Tax=Suillus plorans TaxID=116603 RepID=A0A9P7DA34_9AGAM|nr:uncharacterized protein HD556DRAFT_1459776 [Suillus plorans]KAG1785084.1 hypothetical protein HD556DRAFT_1459776 [Suillus plorans]